MYEVDDLDAVIEITEAPVPCGGAPLPIVLANDHGVVLSYWLPEVPPPYKSRGVESCAIVSFVRPAVHLLGQPNDEAIEGHPLWGRGLHIYGVFRVLNSSLIRSLEKMNSVHPRHNPDQYTSLSHYVFTFHDTCFECVAQSLSAESVEVQEDAERIAKMAERLAARLG